MADPEDLEVLQELLDAIDPRIVIEVQPAEDKTRFRYKSEKKSGKIPGINSTAGNETYPTIKVLNFTGRAIARASCVTSTDDPNGPHPNELFGKDCADGLCEIEFEAKGEKAVEFFDLRIQGTKKSEIEDQLRRREAKEVNPYNTPYDRELDKQIDRNSIRLCFEVFHLSKRRIAGPIVSQNIFHNMHPKVPIKVARISDDWSPCEGGKEIMIFCGRFAEDNIKVRFIESDESTPVECEILLYHRKAGILFKTPPYRPCNGLIELYRPKGENTPSRMHFRYVPAVTNYEALVNKKLPKIQETIRFLQELEQEVSLSSNPTSSQNITPSNSKNQQGQQQPTYAVPSTSQVTREPKYYRQDQTSYNNQYLMNDPNPQKVSQKILKISRTNHKPYK